MWDVNWGEGDAMGVEGWVGAVWRLAIDMAFRAPALAGG